MHEQDQFSLPLPAKFVCSYCSQSSCLSSGRLHCFLPTALWLLQGAQKRKSAKTRLASSSKDFEEIALKTKHFQSCVAPSTYSGSATAQLTPTAAATHRSSCGLKPFQLICDLATWKAAQYLAEKTCHALHHGKSSLKRVLFPSPPRNFLAKPSARPKTRYCITS